MLVTLGLCLLPLLLFAQNEDADDGADLILDTLDLAAWDRWFRSEAPELSFCASLAASFSLSSASSFWSLP